MNEIDQKIQEKTSEATKRKQLIQKYKKGLQHQLKLTPFKSPCAILMRRTGQGEWFENVTKGKFGYKHSSGEEQFIIITGKPITMEYGKTPFQLYILHEDYPLPLPLSHDPIITTEAMNDVLDEAFSSHNKLKIAEWKGRTGFIKAIGWSIAGIILAIALYNLLTGNDQPAQVIAQNITNITNIPQNITIPIYP